MSKKLGAKIARVTGGSSGIGLATAKRFVAEGAKVVITGRREDVLAAAPLEIGSSGSGVQADAGNLAELDKLYAHIKEQHGRIDVLFANAPAFAPAFGAIVSDLSMQVQTLVAKSKWCNSGPKS